MPLFVVLNPRADATGGSHLANGQVQGGHLAPEVFPQRWRDCVLGLGEPTDGGERRSRVSFQPCLVRRCEPRVRAGPHVTEINVRTAGEIYHACEVSTRRDELVTVGHCHGQRVTGSYTGGA